MATLPTLYIPHGGGPCFFMDWDPPETWLSMAAWLRSLAATLPQMPSAIVVISAHWETDEFTVLSSKKPGLLYDYFGFPEDTYKITYPAMGDPYLAHKIQSLLKSAGFETREDRERGFDHGVFIPFKLIYPKADIPIVQLSLKSGLDASIHLEMGGALTSLRQENILLVGSGMSFHNLKAIFKPDARIDDASVDFDAWLQETLQNVGSRDQKLKQWEKAPHARDCHPREEHLLPLMVMAGAAEGEVGAPVFNEKVAGKMISAFQFG